MEPSDGEQMSKKLVMAKLNKERIACNENTANALSFTSRTYNSGYKDGILFAIDLLAGRKALTRFPEES